MRQRLVIVSAGDRQCVIIQLHAADGELSFADDAGAPQQRLDAQQHLLGIDGLGHVIVGSGEKALAFVRGQLLCRDHQDRNRVSRGAQFAREGIAVHAGHHDVQQDEIDMVAVQKRERVLSVDRGYYAVFCAFQHGLHELARVGVVLYDKDMKHGVFLNETIGVW